MQRPAKNHISTANIVTPDYFRALSIPLVRGRLFTARDNEQTPLVALINETAARTYWRGQDALGKRFRVGGFDVPMEKAPWRTIVGVVGDVYQMDWMPNVPRNSIFRTRNFPPVT